MLKVNLQSLFSIIKIGTYARKHDNNDNDDGSSGSRTGYSRDDVEKTLKKVLCLW